MHEFLASEPVTLRMLKAGLSDGEVGFDEKNAMAVVIESRGFTQADGASAAFDFLIPGETELSPGSQIVWRNVTYDVATVRLCRDLDGFPRAIRCTVC